MDVMYIDAKFGYMSQVYYDQNPTEGQVVMQQMF